MYFPFTKFRLEFVNLPATIIRMWWWPLHRFNSGYFRHLITLLPKLYNHAVCKMECTLGAAVKCRELARKHCYTATLTPRSKTNIYAFSFVAWKYISEIIPLNYFILKGLYRIFEYKSEILKSNLKEVAAMSWKKLHYGGLPADISKFLFSLQMQQSYEESVCNTVLQSLLPEVSGSLELAGHMHASRCT